MNDLGPQRFSPKSVAQVNAECKQVAMEFEASVSRPEVTSEDSIVAKKKSVKQVSPHEKFEILIGALRDAFSEAQRAAEKAEFETQSAMVELESRVITGVTGVAGDDAITGERLSEFLDFSREKNHWKASIGRLTFYCRTDGAWGLHFSSTFGGQVGSYRKLKTISEVKLLVELLGVKTLAQLRADAGY